MGRYNDMINPILKEWRNKSIENNDAKETYDGNIAFTLDGLMNKPNVDVEKEWDNPLNRRIMILLKDQPSTDANDARTWLRDEETDSERNLKQKSDNRNLKSKFIHNIANIIYGLSHATIDRNVEYGTLNYDDVRENFLTYPFAFIEAKKQGGNTSISHGELSLYLDRYSDYLKEEIYALNPNMIVCTHVKIYRKIIDFYGGESAMVRISDTEHNSIRYCPGENKLIFLSYHPSARISLERFYYGVMDHFHAFLKTEFARQFFNGAPHQI